MAAARRPEFLGVPAHFDGVGNVKAWIRTLELIYDANGLTIEERLIIEYPSPIGKIGIEDL